MLSTLSNSMVSTVSNSNEAIKEFLEIRSQEYAEFKIIKRIKLTQQQQSEEIADQPMPKINLTKLAKLLKFYNTNKRIQQHLYCKQFVERFIKKLCKRLVKSQFPFQLIYQSFEKYCSKKNINYYEFISCHLKSKITIKSIFTLLHHENFCEYMTKIFLPYFSKEFIEINYFQQEDKKYAQTLMRYFFYQLKHLDSFESNWKQLMDLLKNDCENSSKLHINSTQQKFLNILQKMKNQCQLFHLKQYSVLIDIYIQELLNSSKIIYSLKSQIEQIQKGIEICQQNTLTSKKTNHCCICMQNQSNMVFIPCGHVVCCQSCSEGLDKKNISQCPLCKVSISQKQICNFSFK